MAIRNDLNIRLEDLPVIKKRMEAGLDKGFQWFSWGNIVTGADPISTCCLNSRELAEDICWNPERDPDFLQSAVRLLPAYQALNNTLRELERKGELPVSISVNLDGVEKIDPSNSRKQKNYDRLQEQLKEIWAWDSFSVRHRLINGILTNEPFFEIPLSVVTNDGPMNYYLNFRQNELKDYEFRNFQIATIQIPSLIMNGVNTALLEENMRKVNWATPPFYPPELEKKDKIFRELDKLKRSTEGEELSRKLFQKYIEEPYRQRINTLGTKGSDHWTRQTFPVKKGFRITIEDAWHFFAGRAVFMPVPGNNRPGEKAWFILDTQQKDAAGNALLLQYADRHNYDLAKLINALPFKWNISNNAKDKMANQLYRGGSIYCILSLNGADTGVKITADPLNRTISILDHQKGKTVGVESLSGLSVPNEGNSKPFIYAYDSHLYRQPYVDTKERKEAILKSLNSSDPVSNGLCKKR